MQTYVESFANKIRLHYRDILNPLAEQFIFQRPPTVGELKRPPMVLFLGNHSSGKSTFVNYLLGQQVQRTGVAPTDDNFTIITYGNIDDDRDGASVVGNPDLPFEGLRHFGDQLVSHVRLKLRPVDLLRSVTLIDSPGMIDEAKAESGRGFDYPGAVRWFAERADLVMVFFDPDKPGTTGETLQIFKQSLTGIDHKLLIVMNKMDQFRNLQDFARACGALCWNLGKVIPRKDLPLIYNTFVPLEGQPAPVLPMDDFNRARDDLVAELRRAPARRLDNLITQMQNFAERLRLHMFVIDEAARELQRHRLTVWSSILAILVALSGGVFLVGAVFAIPILAIACALVGGLYELLILPRIRKRKVARLDETFESIHDKELLMRDRSEDLRALWDQVHQRTREVVSKRGLHSFPMLDRYDRDLINRLIDVEIPKLRSDLYARMDRKAVAPRDSSPPANPAQKAPGPWLVHGDGTFTSPTGVTFRTDDTQPEMPAASSPPAL